MTLGTPYTPERFVHDNVAFVSDPHAAGTGVTFCFTERCGGVSTGPYASLNLGTACGDDLSCVMHNRAQLFTALGAPELLKTVAVPRQVHGDRVVVIDQPAHLPAELDEGADAVVCTAFDQAVMLLFADCLPAVLVAPGGFAVLHSGWRGTLQGIAGKTARVLCEATGSDPAELAAYMGPHISAAAYEVSPELLASFEERFGSCACYGQRNLNLSACVRASLKEAGLVDERIVDAGLCTAALSDRFFSYRMNQGVCGRHAAVAFMRSSE